ncbi:MAG: phage virion morphogenesis protein [Pseudomonadota bacterium]
MAGAQLTVDLRGFDTADRALADLAGFEKHQLLDELGQEVEGQTKRRIMSEKTAPDGSPWAPNRTGTPILVQTGALHGSIAHLVTSDETQIGSNLVYAGVHNDGGRAGRGAGFQMTQRQFLGLSAENESDLVALIEDFLARLVP